VFSLHQFPFRCRPPTCDVNHRTQTMTKDNIYQKLFESMVIYPNRHNLWFGSSIYCYFDMIFTKIFIKNKFPKATCNHPPFNNGNFIHSKCHISFHTSTFPPCALVVNYLINFCIYLWDWKNHLIHSMTSIISWKL
jgi:hypothetical protein